MRKTIIFRWDDDGNLKTGLKGFHGTDCIKEATLVGRGIAKVGVNLDLDEMIPTQELKDRKVEILEGIEAGLREALQ